jgi:polar amino acid transport system substrate-binding protein
MRHRLVQGISYASVAVACLAVALPVVAGPVLAETTRERVLREGRIIIGIHNRSPWGYRDESTGAVTGWHPDLLSAAFADLGVDEIEFRVTEFGALIPGLLAGRFDAVASGLAITPERCEQVLFGQPDLRVPDAAIVLDGNPRGIHSYADIAADPEIIMGAGRGSVVVSNAQAAGVPEDQILQFPDIESNMSALRAQRIDVAVISSPTVIGLLAGNGSEGLERADPFTVADDQSNYASVAFRKGDEDLRALYDTQVTALRETGAIDAIMAEYGFGAPEAVPQGITTEQLCDASGASE